MKSKKTTPVKTQSSPVKQIVKNSTTKKKQTFQWPLTGNENEVHLAGDFNHWHPEPMSRHETGFHATVELAPGVYQYKFIIDGQWQPDPAAKENAPNEFGTVNSVVFV